MAFDASGYLLDLHGGPAGGELPEAPAAAIPPGPEDRPPEPAGDAADDPAANDPLARIDFSTWVRRPDFSGRMGWEAPSFPGPAPWWAVSTWAELPNPDPCERCGSLELWQDLLGGWHCQHCERETLARARRWAEKVAELRNRARPPEKRAPESRARAIRGHLPTTDTCSAGAR